MAGVGLELPPTQKPGRGPGPGRHPEPSVPMQGEKRAFCVRRPFRALSLGPELGPRPGVAKQDSAEGCGLAAAGFSSPGPASVGKALPGR